ncbi:PD-(D/E)XK nuclease family transposase [Candidatus Venteria ishoeyi]|uniref:Flagellar assembly protein H n=1 Tax=Candidatus Venteria ishoeyi TaxID=1899563 RepID=A0A1H6F640_9GAMM|nr:PD-(D/E)XK nuclease family transposase [Candidatus Venteria ishoeyi]SEH05013.1 flagellar assembly protein H [Candidatus Venteria ishoeyi]
MKLAKSGEQYPLTLDYTAFHPGYLLKNLEDLSKRPAKLQEKIFEKLFKQAEIANYTDAEYTEYETSLKIYRDLKNSIDTAFDDGKLEGRVEGRAEGMAEGMTKGRAEGLAEGEQQALLCTAEKLKKAGVAVEIIVQTTGLTVREIEGL